MKRLISIIATSLFMSAAQADITVVAMTATDNAINFGNKIFVAESPDVDTDIRKAIDTINFAESAGVPFQIVMMKTANDVLGFEKALAFSKETDIAKLRDDASEHRIDFLHFTKTRNGTLMDIDSVMR